MVSPMQDHESGDLSPTCAPREHRLQAGRADRAITLFVVARNASRTLPCCLESLAALKPPADRVVVLDDGSTDDSLAVANRLGVFVCVVAPPGGIGAARRKAVELCTTPLLGFVNADCYVSPDWLGILRARLTQPEVAVAGGRQLESRCATGAEKWKWLHLRQDWGEDSVSDPPFLSGGNMIIDTHKVSTDFDPGYASAYEDIDFCRRVRSSGWKLHYDATAIVSHDHPETILSLPRKVWSYGAFSSRVGPYRGVAGGIGAYLRYLGRDTNRIRLAIRADRRSRRFLFLAIDAYLLLSVLILFALPQPRRRVARRLDLS